MIRVKRQFRSTRLLSPSHSLRLACHGPPIFQRIKMGENKTEVKLRFSAVCYPAEVRAYYNLDRHAVDKQIFIDQNIEGAGLITGQLIVPVRLLMALFFLGALCCGLSGCDGSRQPHVSPSEKQQITNQLFQQQLADTRSDELFSKFRSATSSVPQSLWPDAQQEFVVGLSADERLRLAERLSKTESASDLWLATSVFLDANRDKDAAATVAKLAKLGPVDFGRFSWSAMHGAPGSVDLTRVVRLYVEAAKSLLPEIEGLSEPQRSNAVAFVSDCGFNPKLEKFSLPAAQERLDRLSRGLSTKPKKT